MTALNVQIYFPFLIYAPLIESRERWIQVDFKQYVIVTGLAIQGGTNERVTLNSLYGQEDGVNKFVIDYQYDFESDNSIWRPYIASSGTREVSICYMTNNISHVR